MIDKTGKRWLIRAEPRVPCSILFGAEASMESHSGVIHGFIIAIHG